MRKIISFSNQQFLRRGWSEEFIEERYKIAEHFKERSRYIAISSPEQPDTYLGTVGFTWAKTTPSQREKLPMEMSHGWNLPRPKGHKNENVLIELRTYAMDPEANAREVFTLLFAKLINSLNDFLASRPDLMDEEILYTYGDEISLRMYRRLGFQENEQLPKVFHLENEWRVLSISPRKFLENIQKLTANIFISNDSTISLFLEDLKVNFNGVQGVSVNAKNNSVHGVSAGPLKLKSGMEFSDLANLYFQNEKPKYLQSLKNDFRISEELTIPAGSSINFTDKGELDDVEHLGRSIQFYGMNIPQGSQIYFGNGLGTLPTLITILGGGQKTHLLPNVEIKFAQLKIEKLEDQIQIMFYADEGTKVNGRSLSSNSIVLLTFKNDNNPQVQVRSR
ncbi:MAG: hypothetical protein ACXWRU_19910 [Pseudobdellovibrionaceae bacterium]